MAFRLTLLPLLLQLIGVSLIVIGIVIRVDPDFTLFTKCLDLARYHVACYLAIISGILLFTLPFISCLGVALQKQYLFFLVSAVIGSTLARVEIKKPTRSARCLVVDTQILIRDVRSPLS